MAAPASGSGLEGKISRNPLFVSWVDSTWIPVLNQNNVLDYFSQRNNPFYDRTCNNEILKMQKLGVADVQLTNMQVSPLLNSFVRFWGEPRINKPSLLKGPEYCLLHVQEPILYVVRKQIRHSLTQVLVCISSTTTIHASRLSDRSLSKVTPVSDYYILAGVIYQAPDIGVYFVGHQNCQSVPGALID